MDFKEVIVITGRRSAGWAQSMVAEVVDGLHALDIHATALDVDLLPQFCDRNLGMRNSQVFVDLNRKIRFLWSRPTVSIMVDHPCMLIPELQGGGLETTVTAWVDASHLPALTALGFSHRAQFLPHAGPTPAGLLARAEERDIDVFFAGNLDEPMDRAGWQAANPGASPGLPDLIFDTIELIEETGAPVLPALLKIADHHAIPVAAFTRDQFADLLSTILQIGEMNRRVNVLAALPEDLKIVVASDHLPMALRNRPNIRHAGYIARFDEIRALMRRSRIVLNITAKFPGGSHERIWFAMAEGAVVATDLSVFMKQDFTEGETILYLPQKRLTGPDLAPIAAIARDVNRLDRMACDAMAIYRDRHTWTTRATLLVDAARLI